MDRKRRVDLRGILADPDLRRELMVPTIQATQAREGIETTREQAERAYYVVTEGERAAFFDLERFRGGRDLPDRRHEMFILALRDGDEGVRFDVARRDFDAIEGAPLAYRRINFIAHLFRDYPSLEPAFGKATKGLATTADSIFVREHWELPADSVGWEPFAKGGEYCRFYYDISLRLLWRDSGKDLYKYLEDKTGGSPTRWINAVDYYFRPGLTWPRRTQRGFNVRLLPEGCIFSDKGPSIFPARDGDMWYLLGVCNSAILEFLLQGLTSFGSWEVGAVQRLPIPKPTATLRDQIATIARSIHDAKAAWDEGNETSTRFGTPWLLRQDLVDDPMSISARLDRLAGREAAEEARIQELYAELNDEVYRLYEIPGSTRAIIEETLGNRPPELLWPQMEGRTVDQKRMEHVFRLLSYIVKRVVEGDDDGVVPFAPLVGDLGLAERVHRELQHLFPMFDVGQVEIEIANELRKNVNGFRRTSGIAEWLAIAFFEFHCSLYKNRPVFWHIASSQGTKPFAFGALVHYHRFDSNRMARLRAQYLRDATEMFRREAVLADKAGMTEARLEWQAQLEEAEELDRKLQSVQEGRHEGPVGGERDFRILTPWKTPEERPRGWAPDLDDGVRVNIMPLQKAGALRLAKAV